MIPAPVVAVEKDWKGTQRAIQRPAIWEFLEGSGLHVLCQ